MSEPNTPRAWSPSDQEKVKTLWSLGHSASQIANTFPGRSRNAVIGIVHRNGWQFLGRATLPGTARAVSAPKVSRSHVQPPKPGPQKKPGAVFGVLSQASSSSTAEIRAERAAEGQKAIARVKVSDVASPNALPFLDARRGCKWPIGEGMAMLSCCNPTTRGVYCEGHARIAFSPVPLRRDYQSGKAATALSRFDRVRAAPRPKPANDDLWDARDIA